MQLDKTRIAVRERGVLDTLDLSLHVMRVYILPLLAAMAIGVLPLMIINHLLIGWMLQDVDNVWDVPFRYLWHMTLLIFLETPLGSVFATKYLGEAVFEDRPRFGKVVYDVLKLLPRIVWCQVLVRGVGVAWLLLLAVDRTGDFNLGLEGFLPSLLVTYAIGLRAFRPFINEIVLLERNPLLSKDNRRITVGRRSGMLHGAASGDLFVRWFASAWIGTLLAAGGYGTLLFISGVLTNDWRQGPLMLLGAYPAAIWASALYLTVFRFLSYLDLRIRQEGWEVELRVRAEAARLAARYA